MSTKLLTVRCRQSQWSIDNNYNCSNVSENPACEGLKGDIPGPPNYFSTAAMFSFSFLATEFRQSSHAEVINKSNLCGAVRSFHSENKSKASFVLDLKLDNQKIFKMLQVFLRPALAALWQGCFETEPNEKLMPPTAKGSKPQNDQRKISAMPTKNAATLKQN